VAKRSAGENRKIDVIGARKRPVTDARRAKGTRGGKRAIGKWYGGKRAAAAGVSLLGLPALGARVSGRTPIEYTNNYFGDRLSAPFMCPLALDYKFVLETPLTVRVPSRNRYQVASAVENRLHDLAQYLSTFLTHPRYGPEKEVGFVRGGTLRPIHLKELKSGTYSFEADGILVGRADLYRFVQGKLEDKTAVPVPTPSMKAGWLHFGINMPKSPDAREVAGDEWYDFTPAKWRRRHPTIGILGLTLRMRPRPERPVITPQYHKLYKSGTVRVALLFGYDEFYSGHSFARDARSIEEIITADPKKRFKATKTHPFGYQGPGLGFSKVVGADQSQPLLFIRDAQHGGQIRITDPTTRSVHRINAEIRVYNFDKSSHKPSSELVKEFVSPFRDNDVIHYDGHANYGGGFYVGNRSNDILWAVDVGSYRDDFSANYQIFSIGACHSAGYFADLFYNDLKPHKSPQNLDILAGVNEEAFPDGVHIAVDLIANLLQIDEPVVGRGLDYEQLLLEINRPSSFQADIGVFGRPGRVVKTRLVASTDRDVSAGALRRAPRKIVRTPASRRRPAVLASIA